MTLSASSLCGLLLLATCAVNVQAARVNKHAEKVAEIKDGNVAEIEEASEATEKQTMEDENPGWKNPKNESDPAQTGYWYTNPRTWQPVSASLVNEEYVQQFKLKEDYRFGRTKKYKAKLEELEEADTGRRHQKMSAEVMTLTNDFFTMHAHQTVEIGMHGEAEYTVSNPHVINRYYTWRVALSSDPNTVLYTIQRRLYNDHCKYAGMFSCKPVLKIYVGHKGDKSTLIYYGVGDDDLDEPDFKFWHSEDAYLADKKDKSKKSWVAKIEHKKRKHSKGEDQYKIKVQPGEDAGLILIASTALDKIADTVRTEDDDDDWHDRHDRYDRY